MLILDKGYMELKHKYVYPLSEYTVPYGKLEYTNMKCIMLEKTQNVVKLENKEYEFYIPKEDLLKGLIGDVSLFYIRSILQKNDYVLIQNENNISANWNIVTNYYLSFFNASLLLRLCHRGNIFFDKEKKKEIESIISTFIGERIAIDSNQFFSIQKKGNEYKLYLTQAESNTHEVVWKKTAEILDEMLMLSNSNSEEKAFLKSCTLINEKLSNTFPSKLRNKINYQPIYGVKYVNKNLFSISENTKWVKEIMSFDINEINGNENRLVNIYSAYTIYMEKLTYRLMQDYFEMNGRKDYILAQVNKSRKQKIDFPEISFTYE